MEIISSTVLEIIMDYGAIRLAAHVFTNEENHRDTMTYLRTFHIKQPNNIIIGHLRPWRPS